jgi:hypothetical protein
MEEVMQETAAKTTPLAETNRKSKKFLNKME